MTSKFKSIMYAYEHSILRQLFFEQPAPFINNIAGRPELLWELLNSFCKEQGEENLYGPEESTLCYNIYFIFDKKFTRKEMFTFEKGVDPLHPEDKDLQFLCGWEKDCHVNYGKVPFDQAEVLMRCFQIYKTKHNIK